MISELNLASGAGTVIDCLATAYRSGGTEAGTPKYKKLCTDLKPTQVNRFRDLANVAVHGDPEHWPGLTTPAVAALGAHFHEAFDSTEAGAANMLFRTRIMTKALQAHGDAPEQHERLAPVLEGLAALLHYLPAHDRGGFSLSMAEMLHRASASALAGPMQPLVQAFRQRIIDGSVSSGERRVLEQILADQALDDQRAEALRPVAEVL